MHQLQKPSATNIYTINMQLTPLGSCRSQARPQANAVGKSTTPLPRLNKATAPAVPNSSCDIHRLLESYSRQIKKTGFCTYDILYLEDYSRSDSPTLLHWHAYAEGEIDCVCQQHQRVLQVDMSASEETHSRLRRQRSVQQWLVGCTGASE